MNKKIKFVSSDSTFNFIYNSSKNICWGFGKINYGNITFKPIELKIFKDFENLQISFSNNQIYFLSSRGLNKGEMIKTNKDNNYWGGYIKFYAE